jgi:predicted Zn-ribbon and HTH transcriptional regulator
VTKFRCHGICLGKEFPVKKLLARPRGRAILQPVKIMSRKAAEMGLAKCRMCEYVTGIVMPRSARCPCCNSQFTRRLVNRLTEKYIG